MASEPDRVPWTVARALAELPPDALWEINAGRLEMHEPATVFHADATAALAACLRDFVLHKGLGRVLAGGAGFWLARDPDVLRAPDVAYISEATMRQIRDPDAFAEVPPDLAVEIISPGDRPATVRRKVAQYLALGVRSVWMVDPRARRLESHRAGGQVRVFTNAADAVEDPVLPGFRRPLRELLPEPWQQ